MARIRLKPSRLAVCLGIIIIGVLPAHSARLKQQTAAAFDRYIVETEQRIAADLRANRFLLIDSLPETVRQETYARLRQGQTYIQRLQTQQGGKPLQAPDGLIHDWIGVAFISGASVAQVLSVLQDYDNHKNIYKPDVQKSMLLERDGNHFKVYLQFCKKSVATVVANADFDVQYTLLGTTRAMSKSYSTRIAELANPGKPDEHELSVGNDHGYIWRLYSYWRIEEKDGGAYIQVESIGLSRRVPWIFAWLVNPLLESIPRGVLSNLLVATRRAVIDNHNARSHSVDVLPEAVRKARPEASRESDGNVQ